MLEKPGEEERWVREEESAEREKGEFRPKDRERELLRAGWRSGERVGLGEGSQQDVARNWVATTARWRVEGSRTRRDECCSPLNPSWKVPSIS